MLQTQQIDGLAHITGGGLTENITRVLPDGLGIEINTSAWSRPEIFTWLQENGAITDLEMLRTFNCGIGMVMIVPEQQAAEISVRAQSMDIECFDIGVVITSDTDSLVHYRS
jgi:phosphoribosylformylglycinamidine cyclo-ligase